MIRLDGYISTEAETMGWTVEEASRRVPGYLDHLQGGNLIAWGRPGSADADPVRLPPIGWNAEIAQCGNRPKKADALWMGQPVFDLRVFPVLLAPSAEVVIGNIPLAMLFSRYVLGDPEVQLLAEAAIRVSPPLADYYGQAGKEAELIWPLDTDDLYGISNCVMNQYANSNFKWTDETQRARDALVLRYEAMIRLLRLRQLIARGDPVRPNDPQEILCTIWGAPNYYLNRRTGDILQDKVWPDQEIEVMPLPDGLHMYEVRWRAVVLEPANSNKEQPALADKCKSHSGVVQERFERCKGLLVQEMRESPHRRPKTKEMYFRDAKKAIRGLGRPAFDGAWAAAKNEVLEAKDAWSAAGAPRKS